MKKIDEESLCFSVIGPKLAHWRSKAKTGELDLIAGTQLKRARENARDLAQKGAEILQTRAEKQKFTGLKLVP